jgi:hypothetical protein
VRTTRHDGAFLRLDDGSVIEMAPRSELQLRGSRTGTTVALERGNIIVHAADQGRDRLAVRTAECEVAVKGTIFAVNHGLKGSRVSVIEGEVEVRHGDAHEVLHPGDQVTTDDRLRMISIADEIAWSANADEHRRLLAELTSLQIEVAEAVDIARPRTSTRLLDLAPPDTAFYVAMPNLTEGLGAARQIFDSRIADSEVLREWWQREIVANGVDRQIEDALDRLQIVGDSLGDEVVVALTASGLSGEGDPLFIAELEDREGFRALLADHLTNHPDGAVPVEIIDRPDESVSDDVELVIWIGGEVVAAARKPAQIRALAERMSSPETKGDDDSELRRVLRQRYAEGVEWLFGADLEWIVAQALAEGGPDELAMMERTGLLETTTLILERHRSTGGSEIDAELRFSDTRRGVASWLAEPAPLATLDFISSDATVVTSAAAKDGLELFDELLALASTAGPDALAELDDFETELGVDLRDDLAAALGGEGSFALDGPVLPVPTWKLVLEVYDPATLEHTIETVIDRANAELAANDAAPIEIVESTAAGLAVTSIRHPSSPIAISYTLTEGHLIAGSSPAAIEHAIQVRNAGMGLVHSPGFRALLPANSFSDASAVFYRNLEPIVGMMPTTSMSPELEAYEQLLRDGAAPGLFCVYGLDDRILVSGTGPSLAALAPLLGMVGMVDSSALEQLIPASAGHGQDRVSSGS